MDIVVAAGNPSGAQARRKDSAQAPFVVPLREKNLRLMGRRVTLRRWPRVASRADLVVMEQARRNIDIYRLLIPQVLRRKRVALWGHGADYAGSVSRLDRLLRRSLTRSADWFFAYSDEGAASVSKQGFDAGQITVLNNSTDTGELRRDLEAVSGSKLAAYQQLHSLGDHTAAYIGALDDGKRIDLLLEAGFEITRKIPDFRLLVAGDGSLRSSVIEALPTSPWLEYLGPVSGEAKALLLASAQVLTVPGSIGLVAVDSLTAGVPIVTSDANRHGPEFSYLRPGHTVEVTPANAKAYSEAVISLLNDKNMMKSMSEACLAASAPFSIERMTDNFIEGLRLCLDTRAMS